jgi:Fe-S-cluster containining protein
MDNPCISCSTNQHCCTQLSELMLTKEEFYGKFHAIEENLLVKQSNNSFIISPKGGKACPHWEKGGCGIYYDRPIDCRLYPYMIIQIVEKRNKVYITYTSKSLCPLKERLQILMPKTDACKLVVEFGKKNFGEEKTIISLYEDGLVSSIRNRIETVINYLFI